MPSTDNTGNNMSSYNQQLLQQMSQAHNSSNNIPNSSIKTSGFSVAPPHGPQPSSNFGRRAHSKPANSATHKRHPTQIAN